MKSKPLLLVGGGRTKLELYSLSDCAMVELKTATAGPFGPCVVVKFRNASPFASFYAAGDGTALVGDSTFIASSTSPAIVAPYKPSIVRLQQQLLKIWATSDSAYFCISGDGHALLFRINKDGNWVADEKW